MVLLLSEKGLVDISFPSAGFSLSVGTFWKRTRIVSCVEPVPVSVLSLRSKLSIACVEWGWEEV